MIGGLLGSLVIASLAFMAYGPTPLMKAQSLAVVDPDVLYKTQTAMRKWSTLYIHHSKTQDDDMDVRSIGDHFVIGNGNAVGDGEIVIGSQWLGQKEGMINGKAIDGGWISIALEGDFDQTPPTAAQVKRVGELLAELQDHFAIPTDQVIVRNVYRSPEGIGNLFPKQELSRYLNP